jgi:hypothetical protein
MFLRSVFVRSGLISGLLLLISLGLLWHSMRGESAACDEFEHLISGYAFLRQIDLYGMFTDNSDLPTTPLYWTSDACGYNVWLGPGGKVFCPGAISDVPCLAPFCHDRKKASWQGRMLLLAALIYALASMSTRINIGVRHLLPLYPLLIIWVSQIVYWPLQQHALNASKTLLLTGLACWYIFGVISVHPHCLAYFNELAGGSSNGYRYLSDSNVDHGQDIKRLGAYLNAAGIKEVTVLCSSKSSNLWGCPSATYYMPNATPWDPKLPPSSSDELPTGFFVVGKTPRWLTGEFLQRYPQALDKWQEMQIKLQDLVPLATIGYSTDLYYLR